MAENPPPAATPASTPEPAQQRFKEVVTAVIALMVVAGTAALAAVAVGQIADKETFARAKDLLLFVNPILGYVVGYYFNKTITDRSVDRADAKAGALKSTLQNVVGAGRQVVGARGAQPKVLGGATLGQPAADDAAAIRLAAALDQAETVMQL